MKETPKSTNTFDGSLNTDTDKFLIDEKDYLDAVNIRNTINDANKFGLATNAKGNTLLTYTQPTGQNTVLGSYENLSTGECYYVAWNSGGISQIRKVENREVKLLANRITWLDRKHIPFINLIDNRLMYWTDTEPRQIDLDKSRADKIHEGNIYYVSGTTPFIPVGTTVTIGILDENNNVLAVDGFATFVGFDQQQFAAFVAAFINASAALSALCTATECLGYTEITFNQEGYYLIDMPLANTTASAVYVPQNYYETIFEGITEAGRRPLNCNPTTTLKFDSTKEVNNLTESAWQFRAQVIYSNNNKSVLSPASDLVYIKCETSKNYIEIDFTDDKLLGTATEWLSDIKAVRIVGRPANDSKYREVAYIEQKDLWKYSGSIARLTYHFYNDGQYAVIDDITSETQYHNTPIEPVDDNYSICQETFDDRLGYSRFNQDYDTPCIEATLTPAFTENEPEDYELVINVRIKNQQQFYNSGGTNSANNYGDGQIGAIYQTAEQAYPVWGAACDRNVGEFTAMNLEQYLPEAGFIGYLAGTEYFGISSQQRSIGDLEYFPNNVIDCTTAPLRATLNTWYDVYNSGAVANMDMRSTLVIKGIKEGKYVFRLASHWCSFGDKLGKGGFYDLYNGQKYQQTSTNTRSFQVVDENGNQVTDYEGTEIIVEFTNDTITLSNYNGIITSWTNTSRSFYLGTVKVEDLAIPELSSADLINLTNFSGYVVDTGLGIRPGAQPTGTYLAPGLVAGIGGTSGTVVTNPSDPDTKEAILMAARCELCQVLVSRDATNQGQFLVRPVLNVPPNGVLILPTDHNGYYYYKGVQNAFTRTDLYGIRYGSIEGRNSSSDRFFITAQSGVGTASILRDIYESGGYLESDHFSAGLHMQGYIFTTNTNFSTECAVVVQGTVVDEDGGGVGCANAVITRNGRQESTQSDGTFSILVYEDGQQPPNFGNSQRILDQLIFNACADCVVTFDNNSNKIYTSIGLGITPISAAGYNIANPFIVADITTIRVLEFARKLKAGGTYNFALLHVDTRNRRSNIFTDGLDVSIPFLTENVSNYFPSLPSQIANGAFSFTLDVTSAPPVWADKLYVLRTQDQFYLDYLQFSLFDAQYVISYDEETQTLVSTTYETFSANQIYLGFLEATDVYREINVGSNKGWSYEKGDRVRFIKDKDNTFYETQFDFEIQDVKTDSVTGFRYYVIDALDALGKVTIGTVVEVYRPKKNLEYTQKLYFEIHTCIDIVNSAYVGLPLLLETGDTYPRSRTMITENGTVTTGIEDNAISDFWISKDQDIGRPNFERREFAQIKQTNVVVYSGKFQQSNKQNNLNEILLTNIAYFPINYGWINSLKLANDSKDTQVLLIICENKAISVYIGTVQLNDVVGTELITTSDAVLGSYRTLAGTSGTVNPESVHRKNSIVYWYDLKRKKWWKYDNNGIDAISDRKIKALAESITPSAVISAFEDYYEQYQTTAYSDVLLSGTLSGGALQYFISKQTGRFPFTQSNTSFAVNQTVILEINNTRVHGYITANNPLEIQALESTAFMPNSAETVEYNVYAYLTLAYFEPANKWETKFSYAPEYYGSGGEDYFAFHNGNAYLMSSNETRNNWFGIQFKSTITVISKVAAKAVKIYLSYKQIANKYWKTVFQTPPNATYPFGMKTTAEESEAQLLEGVWNSQILRNENDPAFFGNPVGARYNSKDNLRGYFVEAALENEGTTQAEVRSIDVFQIPSEQTSD